MVVTIQRLAVVLLALSCIALGSGRAAEESKPGGGEHEALVNFAADVQPLLKQRCVSCHNASFQTAHLRLDDKDAALQGGDSGPVILPGNAAESLLIRRISGSDLGLRMPPTGALPDREIAVLRKWIDEGAEWPDAAVDTETGAGTTAETGLLSEAQKELYAAIRRNDFTEVSRLLATDIDIGVTDRFGESPLMYAALHAGPEIVKGLLDYGADPNEANRAGATALMRATANRGSVRVLIGAGARVDERSEMGRTALLIAARRPGSRPVVRDLIGSGADPNAKDVRGVTPLMEAARTGDIDAMDELVEAGARINETRSNGRTALMAAVRSRRQEAVWFLIDRGADVNVQALEGVSSNSKDTALTMAAARGVPGIVRALIGANADLEARNAMGYTALMQAACSDYVDAAIVRALLVAGADIAPKGVDGETALTLARQRGETEIVQLLLEAERDAE